MQSQEPVWMLVSYNIVMIQVVLGFVMSTSKTQITTKWVV